MKRIITLLLIMSALIPAATAHADDSRNRGYGFLMLEEPVSPRNAAMGSAGTALGSGGFRYYNPALPFFSESSFASAEFGQMPGGVNKAGFETALIKRDWFSAISFHSSTVDFETRDEKGFGAVTSSGTTIGALGAGYIRDNLAAAVSINMADDRVWVESAYSAVALSAGLGYKLLDGKMNLGAAGFHGIAWSRDSAAGWIGGRVPRFARAGAAWMDTLKSFPYTVTADLVYRDEDGTFTVPVGVEVSLLPYINARIGKRIGWDDEIMSFGLGFNIDRISFDAAFIPTVFVSDYEIKWSMGFTYSMGTRRSVTPPREPITAEPAIPAKPTPEPKPEPEELPEEPETAEPETESEQTESADESGQAESTEKTESTEPSEETEPADESEPTEPTDDSEAAKTSEETEPTDESAPAKPTDDSETAEPSEETEPAKPADESIPAKSTDEPSD
jgi:hypothetical protein